MTYHIRDYDTEEIEGLFIEGLKEMSKDICRSKASIKDVTIKLVR